MEASKMEDKSFKKEMIMHISELFILIISFAGMFFWSISESKEDNRLLQVMMNENRIELQTVINAIHNEIHQEMKDFHGRLCALEEKNKKG